MLERLEQINQRKIYAVEHTQFKTYGKIIKEVDFSELIEYTENNTSIPEQGNIYCESIAEMEQNEIYKTIKNELYGGLDIQIGYCNGKNSTLNGLEYHKGSEINIAVTDLMLFLGHSWDIEDNCYQSEQAEVFYVKKGQAIEFYQTTLHLSPCKVEKDGFKAIVILPRATNTKLDNEISPTTEEGRLLLKKNKWVIAHPQRQALIAQGAFAGIIGDNLELLF